MAFVPPHLSIPLTRSGISLGRLGRTIPFISTSTSASVSTFSFTSTSIIRRNAKAVVKRTSTIQCALEWKRSSSSSSSSGSSGSSQPSNYNRGQGQRRDWDRGGDRGRNRDGDKSVQSRWDRPRSDWDSSRDSGRDSGRNYGRDSGRDSGRDGYRDNRGYNKSDRLDVGRRRNPPSSSGYDSGSDVSDKGSGYEQDSSSGWGNDSDSGERKRQFASRRRPEFDSPNRIRPRSREQQPRRYPSDDDNEGDVRDVRDNDGDGWDEGDGGDDQFGDYPDYGDLKTELQQLLQSPHDFIYGVSPVLAALNSMRRSKIYKLYLQDQLDTSKRKDRAGVAKIHELARKHGIEAKYLNKGDLNNLARQRPHQGFILEAERLEFEPLPFLPKQQVSTRDSRRPPLWLVLDEIMDPQNLGALLRTSWFLGVDGVVVCTKNSCPLSPVVSKASSGALEVMPVHGVSSMLRFLQQSKANGWRCLGTVLGGEAIDSKSLALEAPTMIVLGNEGHGLRTMIARECEVQVRIGVSDAIDSGLVDSLNVSVAGGVLLYQLLGK